MKGCERNAYLHLRHKTQQSGGYNLVLAKFKPIAKHGIFRAKKQKIELNCVYLE
jgi:hypothetical protein